MNEPEPVFAGGAPHSADMEGQDERMCRICQEGADAGHLISPCRCRGTIKYVHRECLERWRTMSANPRAAFECDQCKFKYSFQRTQVASVLSARWALHVLTLLTTGVIIILAGYGAKLADRLRDEDDRWFDSFWLIDVEHIVMGTIIIGIAGFVSLAGHLIGFHRPLGMWNIRGGGGGSGGTGGKDWGTIVVGVVVVVGLIKAMVSLYGVVERVTHRYLAHAQAMVENIETDQNQPAPAARRRRARAATPRDASAQRPAAATFTASAASSSSSSSSSTSSSSSPLITKRVQVATDGSYSQVDGNGSAAVSSGSAATEAAGATLSPLASSATVAAPGGASWNVTPRTVNSAGEEQTGGAASVLHQRRSALM